MKKVLLFLMCLLALQGCQKLSFDETANTDEQSQVITKNVQFVMKGLDIEYATRATLTSENLTDLWVWEGTTLLKHQVNTDADFGTPTIALTYGSHDLTFVASKADGQSWSSGIWSTTKEWDTFATTMNITISSNSSNSRQVQLARRSSKIKFATQDKIPEEVKTMHLTVQNHKSLNANLIGGNEYVHEATVNMTSKIGSTYSVSVNVLTESPTDEEDCDVMIEFLDTNNTILYHYERTVSIKANRATILTGNYFSGETNQINIVNTWLDELNIPL